jgi:hypothetical protein
LSLHPAGGWPDACSSQPALVMLALTLNSMNDGTAARFAQVQL